MGYLIFAVFLQIFVWIIRYLLVKPISIVIEGAKYPAMISFNGWQYFKCRHLIWSWKKIWIHEKGDYFLIFFKTIIGPVLYCAVVCQAIMMFAVLITDSMIDSVKRKMKNE